MADQQIGGAVLQREREEIGGTRHLGADVATHESATRQVYEAPTLGFASLTTSLQMDETPASYTPPCHNRQPCPPIPSKPSTRKARRTAACWRPTRPRPRA